MIDRVLARSAKIVRGGFAGTAIRDDLVADLLAFTQRAEAGALDADCLAGLARDIAGLYDQIAKAYFS